MSAFKPNPRQPKLKLPPGACDTHFHCVGPLARFPAAPGAYTPASDAPKEALFKLHDFLGVERGVVVQTAVHGFDNSASADLIAARPDNYVGVALVPVDATHSQIKKLDRQGFRGARFHYMKLAHLGAHTPIDAVLKLAEKQMEEMNWHLQLHLDATLLDQLAPAIHRSPVPVVVDHMGRIDASTGAGFDDLLKLLEDKNIWVKVSAPERASKQSAPWRDAMPFARKLVEEFGDRAMWGTDWPHPNLKEVPDDGDLVDYIAEVVPSEAARRKLLVDNPKRFYRFA